MGDCPVGGDDDVVLGQEVEQFVALGGVVAGDGGVLGVLADLGLPLAEQGQGHDDQVLSLVPL